MITEQYETLAAALSQAEAQTKIIGLCAALLDGLIDLANTHTRAVAEEHDQSGDASKAADFSMNANGSHLYSNFGNLYI